MRLIRPAALAAVALLPLFAACGQKEPDSPLGYVPADTPYVFANLEPVPQSYIDTVSAKFAPMASVYEGMIGDALAELEKQPQDDVATKAVRAMLEELKGKISIAGFESLGFSTQARSAIYGIGLVPVARIELKDTDAFAAFLARVEKRVGEPMPSATVGEQSYWRIGKADGEVFALIALVHGDLVLSIAPKNASDALLEQLLGLELPEETLADDNRIAALNEQYGFTPHGSGYLDVTRVATALLDEKTGIEREFLAALGEQDTPTTPECRSEILAIAAKMPRMVAGYSQFDVAKVDARMVLELEPALAKELARIAAPVPGLGQASDSLVDFGLSINLTTLGGFVGVQARAVAAAPFKCPQLADLNAQFSELQTQMSNPMAFAAAPVFRGFHAALTRFEMPADAPPVFAGKLAIASDNPQSLVALAGNMLPAINQMGLKANAAPVPLPADVAPPGTPPAWVAMSDKVLGIAIGDGEQETLQQFIAAPAGSPAPLLTFGYSGRFFETVAEASLAAMEQTDPVEREKAERAMKMMRDVYSKILKRTDFTLLLTDRGVEVRDTMEFN